MSIIKTWNIRYVKHTEEKNSDQTTAIIYRDKDLNIIKRNCANMLDKILYEL